MKKGIFSIIFVLLVVAITFLYYSAPFYSEKVDSIFLTISTFLFAIFTGFSISRQNARHTLIRDEMARFDGAMTTIYRNFEIIGGEALDKVRLIIQSAYKPIVERKVQWDSLFSRETTILSSLYKTFKEQVPNKDIQPVLQNEAVRRTGAALYNAQVIRKRVIALRDERMPLVQWILIYVLMIVLLSALTILIKSQGVLFLSLLKASFASSVIFVVVLLYRLTALKFYEKVIGEHSAQDVVDIIGGKK